MLKKRSEIADKYKWNIEAMYASQADWESDYEKAEKKANEYKKFSGHLSDSGKDLLKAFKAADAMWQITEKVYVYARMKRDEDNTVATAQALTARSQTLIANVSTASSFFTPEFLSISNKRLNELLAEEKGLKAYKYSIDCMLREKAHVLSKKEENLLAQLGEVLDSTGDVFTMLNNADLKFGAIKDEKGKKTELTHGNYITFMESSDRKVRKSAYNSMYSSYIQHKNTLATTYAYNTKTDVVSARLRKYDGAIEKALSGDNVPISVYENLIKSVSENLGTMHKYMDIKANLLGLKKLNMYDVYVPLFKLRSDKVPYEDAVTLMNDGLKPLGKDYLKNMNEGVKAGWIDVFENQNKTSGAYSFGSYDSMPYILMNYSGRLKDVFTLVHEMGHSMHSHYTRKTQPFRYGGHSIFTAEVASTVNESLLMHHLLDTRTSKNEQKYIVNMYIEEFRTTLFRQTMFAEFELLTHRAVENGEVLTAEFLSEEYGKLNEKYFGKNVVTDDNIRMEWSRIPHFYRAFYVYKYATGFSAATAISDGILNDGAKKVADYIEFLKSGDSNDPIELLKIAGIDMGTPQPVENAMKVFGELVDKLESLI